MIHAKILAIAATALIASGCANMTDMQRRTATGAGIGAASGAVLGAVTGGSGTTGAVIGAGVGALGTYIWSRNMENQRRDMEQATRGTGVVVSQTQDNQLRLEIPSDISFDTNSSRINSAFRPVLDQFAQGLRDNQRTQVRIVGHTDSTGSDAINEPLSVDRAASTRNYLADRGVDPQRVSIEGRGSRQPVASNDSAQGRERNRRVEIYVGERQAG